ncbi:MAG TPA: tRNA epoxyqueuosine(34) reductase QueG [Acidimicrobiales bacterium]|nr:tRNA epoxyqueuosine(34) reductase QueG [Acidimicrobiales bacterium]
MNPPVPTIEELRAVSGLDALGVADAAPFTDTREVLERRRAAGLHGGMAFTYRNPARATTPARALPDARALVVGALGYRRAADRRPVRPAGAVARYARDDHYASLRRGLDAVADRLRADGWRTLMLVDDNALVDRAAAVRAGLGWYGKSTNVLLPGRGSWFVLGSVVTDAPLAPSSAPVADGCGPCTRCIDACPTGAIVAPGVVDARRCLAWLVQQAGPFPTEHRAALGDRIYGCDDCQEVCPPNRAEDRRAPAPPGGSAWVGLLELLAATDEELLDRHGRWYIPARDPRYLRRNALVALGNVGDRRDPEVRGVLERYRDGDDELLAEHASWALQQ